MRKFRELISLHFLNLSFFPHSLSISSSFFHSLSIISQPGCQAARLPQFVQPCWMIKMIVRPSANRSSELLKSIGNFFGTPCVASAMKQTPHLIPDIFQHFVPPCVKGGRAEGGVPAVVLEPGCQVHPAMHAFVISKW